MRPILFQIGSFPVHTFGVLLMIAFLASILMLRTRAERFGTTKDAITDVAFWTVIAGVLGARLLFIVQEWSYYSTHTKELLSWQFQGLTSFGGLIGGGIAAVIVGRRHGIEPRRLLDLVAPSFLLGHAIGRIGCFFNGCCAGRVCDLPAPWFAVPGETGSLQYPAQLLDSSLNFASLGLVLLLERRGLRPLATTGCVLFLHGLSRFIYEFFRAAPMGADGRPQGGSSTIWVSLGPIPFTEAHAVAFGIMLVGLGFLSFGATRRGQVRAA